MPQPLILASTSPYRRALLERLGVPFTAVKPACDEESLKSPGMRPQEMAEALALAKARSLAARQPDAVVIGSDQVCALGDEVLHKPGSTERACAQLARLAGREHALITAVAILTADGRELRHTDVTRLHMRALGAGAIARYVAADRPLDCSGAYKLECRGIALFERIDSADHTAIVGLPLIWLAGALAGLGYETP